MCCPGGFAKKRPAAGYSGMRSEPCRDAEPTEVRGPRPPPECEARAWKREPQPEREGPLLGTRDPLLGREAPCWGATERESQACHLAAFAGRARVQQHGRRSRAWGLWLYAEAGLLRMSTRGEISFLVATGMVISLKLAG